MKWRFSLLSAGIVVTCLCVALGIWTERARGQQRLVLALGGRDNARAALLYDYQEAYANDNMGVERPDGPPHVPEFLLQTLGEDYFASIIMVDFTLLQTPVGDDVVAGVARLPRLRLIRFGYERLTPDQIEKIRTSQRSVEVLDWKTEPHKNSHDLEE